MGCQIIKLGTLYFDGEPQQIRGTEQGYRYPDKLLSYDGATEITIGDSQPLQMLRWVKPDGLNILVCANTLFTHVDWDTLNEQGYVSGKFVKIDGRHYICRLLQMSAENYEWAEVLDKAGREDDELWGWESSYFWCSGQSQSCWPDYCNTVGFTGAADCNAHRKDYVDDDVGFRPVLELVPQISLQAGRKFVLEGQKFAVFQVAETCDHMLYPILTPAKELSGLVFDAKVFQSVADGSELRMFTLLMDGVPVRQDNEDPEAYRPGARLEFTDRYFGEEYLIAWTASRKHAVATRSILKDISQEVLAEQGFCAARK